MPKKKDIPWYLWKFHIGSVLLSLCILGVLYKTITESDGFTWLNIIAVVILLYLLYWIAKSEWIHRKSRHININKEEFEKDPPEIPDILPEENDKPDQPLKTPD